MCSTQHGGAVASHRASWFHCIMKNNSRGLQGLSSDCCTSRCPLCLQKPCMPGWGSQRRKASEGRSFQLLVEAAAWAGGLYKSQSLPVFAQGPLLWVGEDLPFPWALSLSAQTEPGCLARKYPKATKIPDSLWQRSDFPQASHCLSLCSLYCHRAAGRGLVPSGGS